MEQIRDRAAQLLARPVHRADLALAFDETLASTVDVHVEGRNFYPPMLRDIGFATSSVHVNQFGFRRGEIGAAFADALLAKAAEGVPVRLVVDSRGSDPDGSSRDLYERLLAGGIEVRVVRATQPRALTQPAAAGGPARSNIRGLGHIDHRKVVVVDGRIGWVGDAGIEDHFHDGRRGVRVRLFVPADANNWACAAAQQFHHRALLEAGVRILEYPSMLHAKAFVRDGEHVLAGTCTLEARSLKRFFELDVLVRSPAVAAFEERFSTPAEVVSIPGRALTGLRERLRASAFAAISPLL